MQASALRDPEYWLVQAVPWVVFLILGVAGKLVLRRLRSGATASYDALTRRLAGRAEKRAREILGAPSGFEESIAREFRLRFTAAECLIIAGATYIIWLFFRAYAVNQSIGLVWIAGFNLAFYGWIIVRFRAEFERLTREAAGELREKLDTRAASPPEADPARPTNANT